MPNQHKSYRSQARRASRLDTAGHGRVCQDNFTEERPPHLNERNFSSVYQAGLNTHSDLPDTTHIDQGMAHMHLDNTWGEEFSPYHSASAIRRHGHIDGADEHQYPYPTSLHSDGSTNSTIKEGMRDPENSHHQHVLEHDYHSTTASLTEAAMRAHDRDIVAERYGRYTGNVGDWVSADRGFNGWPMPPNDLPLRDLGGSMHVSRRSSSHTNHTYTSTSSSWVLVGSQESAAAAYVESTNDDLVAAGGQFNDVPAYTYSMPGSALVVESPYGYR